MAEQSSKTVVSSPCISVCVLDDDDVCIGCWRTGQEISRWGTLDDAGKRDVLRKVDARMRGEHVP